MTNCDYLTYKEASERFGTSRSKVTRAVQSGLLIPETKRLHGRDVLALRLDDLERWAEKEGLWSSAVTSDDQVVNREQPRLTEVDHERSTVNTSGHSRLTANDREQSSDQTPGLHESLLDRMEQIHRRAIVLELQLQQTQRLLCENNESQHEREARALEAEAKAEAARLEAEQAKQEAARAIIELGTLKTEMSVKEAAWSEARKPWYKKLFGKAV